jgi:hypothetical protein
MKNLILILSLLSAIVCGAYAQTYGQWTGTFDSVIGGANLSSAAKTWIKSTVAAGGNPGVPFADPGSIPTASPTPIPQGINPPEQPVKAPAFVTDCPALVFSDTFGGVFAPTLWGPIVPPQKWITDKPDGLSFGGFFSAPSGVSHYSTASGHLVITMYNYYQAGPPAPATNLKGTGSWTTGMISSAAWKNQTGGGPTTGFMAKAPCYFETAVWIPRLTPSDLPNTAGLWPSISLYTDPELTSGVGSSCEIDLLEAYSIDYTIPHFSLHVWSASGVSLPGGTSATPKMADLSQGWHIYGVWIDTKTITYYLDDVVVLTAPTPAVVGLEPFYILLEPGYGGGWTVSESPAQTYNMHVAYVECWSH